MDEARVHFDRGVQLYTEHSYDAALVEFERANELAPTYRILYNIGQIQQQLHRYAQAVTAFEQYLAQGGPNVPDARRAEVAQALDTLRTRVASVDLRVNVPGAEISLDDEVVGTSPLPRAVSVNPGRRRFSATRPGYMPASSVVNVAGSDALVVRLDLMSVAAPRESSAVAPVARGPSRVPMYVGWIATAAMAVGAGVMMGLANSASNTLVQDRMMFDSNGTLADTLQRDRSSVVTYSLTADALWISAILSGAASIYLTVTALRAPSHHAATRAVGCSPATLSCRF